MTKEEHTLIDRVVLSLHGVSISELTNNFQTYDLIYANYCVLTPDSSATTQFLSRYASVLSAS